MFVMLIFSRFAKKTEMAQPFIVKSLGYVTLPSIILNRCKRTSLERALYQKV